MTSVAKVWVWKLSPSYEVRKTVFLGGACSVAVISHDVINFLDFNRI